MSRKNTHNDNIMQGIKGMNYDIDIILNKFTDFLVSDKIALNEFQKEKLDNIIEELWDFKRNIEY